ncbi:MAG: hypothetical protein HRT52_21925 [Colwellia sp.]|nr:hypothetical protein [Colwellia sp.]
MHLTDEKLLELNESGKEHLLQCTKCKQRAKVLIGIRQQLDQQICQSSTLPDFKASWHIVKQVHEEVHQQSESLQKVKTTKAQHKITFWQVSTMMLAASLLIVAIFPHMKVNPEIELPVANKIVLVKWIEENVQLQQLFEQQYNNNLLTRVSINQLQFKLASIDDLLQQAYFKNASDEEKLTLWQQRKKIIKNSLLNIKKLKLKNSHTISI